jgi:hypothetical protein
VGVFNIHPKSAAYSSITCSLLEDSTTDYQVTPGSIDLNEGERVMALSGDSRALNEFAVSIKFSVAVFGATQAEVISNTETLRQALSDERGGYIEYRPRGLGVSVLTTWYEYKAGSSPVLALGAKAFDHGVLDSVLKQLNRTDSAVMVNCALDTRSIATSDPSSLISLSGPTSIDNYDDGTHDNSITLSNSSIKGIGIRPVVYVGATTTNSDDAILMHVKKMRVGANSRVGWIEAETYGNGNWPTASDATVSNDEYCAATGLGYINFPLTGDSTYVGYIKPIMCIRQAASLSGKNEINFSISPPAGSPNIVTTFKGWGPGDTNWYLFFGMREVVWPPWKIPPWVTDSTTPSVSDYLGAENVFAVQHGYDGEPFSTFDLDFVYLATAHDWIGILDYTEVDASANYRAVFDGVSQSGYTANSASNDEFVKPANKRGSPWRNLLLEKGWDYRFTFFAMKMGGTYSFADGYGRYDHDTTMSVTVKGLYLTVYPFSES